MGDPKLNTDLFNEHGVPLRIEPIDDPDQLGDYRVIAYGDSNHHDVVIGRLIHFKACPDFDMVEGWTHTGLGKNGKRWPTGPEAAIALYNSKLEGISRNLEVKHRRPIEGSTPFYQVTLGVGHSSLTLWFSYQTIIAFQGAGFGTVVHENYWGPTTGKHLNWIDCGDKEAKAKRLSGDDFKLRLAAALGNIATSFADFKLDRHVEVIDTGERRNDDE
jgi:hypothetical protein